jgi:hypothetical protein
MGILGEKSQDLDCALKDPAVDPFVSFSEFGSETTDHSKSAYG